MRFNIKNLFKKSAEIEATGTQLGWSSIISNKSALEKSTWFFACVKYKAESAGQVKLRVFNGDKEVELQAFKKPNEQNHQ